jgi:hypothetical protein
VDQQLDGIPAEESLEMETLNNSGLVLTFT